MRPSPPSTVLTVPFSAPPTYSMKVTALFQRSSCRAGGVRLSLVHPLLHTKFQTDTKDIIYLSAARGSEVCFMLVL